MSTQLVWFKKDLRLRDHEPLTKALECGPCLLVYVVEPEMINNDDYDYRHWQFLKVSIDDLAQQVKALGGRLSILYGNLPEAFESLYQTIPFDALWSHEETGNGLSYARDLRVARWAKARGIRWQEFTQNGVVRRLKSRDGWATLWEKRMQQKPLCPPLEISSPDTAFPDTLPEIDVPTECSAQWAQLQKGGETEAHLLMQSFLTSRGKYYQQQMSSPLTAESACSRLSPYLSFGCLSMPEVYHAVHDAIIYHANMPATPDSRQWLRSLRSFEKRLHWHCHFMQKLEDEPEIEFYNMNRAFDGLRESTFNEELFEAWKLGLTGYPFVDACMRCLRQTGWINFRMRAMLVSFAAYHLWLHWDRPARYLARLFTDFEPGIHYSQFQMQSGVTGINAIRIYSPTKQSIEQDPKGEFIRRFVPELNDLPVPFIHQPETLGQLLALSYGYTPGVTYPHPVVVHEEAYRTARDKVFTWKKRPEVQAVSALVLEKHGSRNTPRTPQKGYRS